jgi:hypothetical protein
LRGLRKGWVGGRSADRCCARRERGDRRSFSAVREGVRVLTFQCSLRPDRLPLGRFGACPLCGPFPMTSEVGTDLRAVRPPGTGLVVLTVESACSGEWRYFVMFAGVALSGKSPYLGGSRVWLSLWQEPGMWPEDLRGRFRACPLCGPFPLEVRGGCSPMTSEVGTDLRAVRPCFGLSLAWG